MFDLMFALAGPIVWAVHFFGLYLAESFLCPPALSSASAIIRPFAVILTVIALMVLVWLRMNARAPAEMSSGTSNPLSFQRPLVDISIVAVVWTSIPIFLIDACSGSTG
jgi:hypothetical protein